MKTHPSTQNTPAAGFSLVELLVVMAVIALIASLALPAFNAITHASSIEYSADQIVGALSLARQSAVTKKKAIEVRFYDVAYEGWPTDYRAYQLFEIADSGSASQMTKIFTLKPPTVMARNTDPSVSGTQSLSTLLTDNLSNPRAKNWTTLDPTLDPKIPLRISGSSVTNYNCCAFRFRPNGTTDLPVDAKWHVTVVDAHHPGSFQSPPSNFATVWVEPATGAVKVLRP